MLLQIVFKCFNINVWGRAGWSNRNHHTTIVNNSSLFLCCLKTIDDKLRIPTVLIPSRTPSQGGPDPIHWGWECSP